MTNPASYANQLALQPARPTSTLRWLLGWRFWITRGSLAVLDQALISGSNFLIGILLARWLLPEQYGSYALTFSIFLLISFFHQALVLEPQRVFGSAEYPHLAKGYLGLLILIQSGLTLVLAVTLGLAVWLAHLWASQDGLEGALAGMTLAAPFVLLLWLVRGAFYVQMIPQYAVIGSTVYCVAVLCSLLIVDKLRLMSPFWAFVMMGLAALISSVFLLERLKPILNLKVNGLNWRVVTAQHWNYGRWLLASFVLSWIPANLYYYLFSFFSGLAAVGELKVLLNFTLPVAQTLTALSVCFLPHASRVCQRDGLQALRKLTFKIACLFAAAAIAYWAILIFFGAPILRFLYGGHYGKLASLIPWVAAGSIPWNLATVPTIALRAVRSSVSIFRVYLATSGITVLLGVPATWRLGLRGALMAIIVSNASALGLALLLMCRELRMAWTKGT
jgi:O-antigen/teichoic acid export membrane protein